METKKNGTGLCGAFLLPHPPILVSEVGKGQEREAKKTLEAYRRAADRIAEMQPETIVVISPHAPLFRDFLFTYDQPVLSGTFARFGAGSTGLACPQDSDFLASFTVELRKAGIPGGPLAPDQLDHFDLHDELDHGVLVPLYFICAALREFRLVALSSSAFGTPEVLRTGACLARAAKASGRRVCIVASGDMSHKVNRQSPYGMAKDGSVHDEAVCRAIRESRLSDVLSIPLDLRESAAECGINSLIMLAGAFGLTEEKAGAVPDPSSEVLSYEAPFGIGYCVASFRPAYTGCPSGRHAGAASENPGDKPEENPPESIPVTIARSTIDCFVRTGRIPDPGEFPAFEAERAGCFVSLKKHGELRGCIGTIAPVTGSIGDEIVRNAVSACSEDPRFDPVESDELDELTVSVDILGQPEPVGSNDELDPSTYGVIVTSGYRRGLLLPDLEGVDTVELQLAIACRKGGISPEEPYGIQRFRVTRYH